MCREHLRTVLENLQQIAHGMQKQQQGDPVSMTTFSVSVPVTVAVLVWQQSTLVEFLIFQLPSNAAVVSAAAISILVPVAVLRVSRSRRRRPSKHARLLCRIAISEMHEFASRATRRRSIERRTNHTWLG